MLGVRLAWKKETDCGKELLKILTNLWITLYCC